jgi:hypothetical protein
MRLLLTAPGDDPGPSGKVFLAYKRNSSRKPGFSSKHVAELAELLGIAWDEPLAVSTATAADEALQSGRAAPLAAAELVTTLCAARPDAEPLAWALADIIDRRKTQMAVPSSAADGRTVRSGLPNGRGKGADAPWRGGLPHSYLFSSG